MIDFSLKHSQRDPKQYQWSSKLRVADMDKDQLQQAVCIMLDMVEELTDAQRTSVERLDAFLRKG